MTSDKARKLATRRRMAETGEPYSLARRAAEGGETAGQPDEPEETPEQRYLREAQDAGVPAADLDALRAAFEAGDGARQLRWAAQAARIRADEAEKLAEQAEERAELAQEAADLAQEWAGP